MDESKQNTSVKWGLSKVRERETQREHGGVQVETAGRERACLFQVLLKPALTHGKGRPRGVPPNNE
jgi:hypothetical protein